MRTRRIAELVGQQPGGLSERFEVVGLPLQCLLQGGELDGVRVIGAETLGLALRERTRLQVDSTFGLPVRYGLGFMLGGGRFSFFGLGTRGAFGHIGFTNVVAFADPARALVFVLSNTGKPFLHPGMLRWFWVMQRATLTIPRVRGSLSA